VQMMMAGFADSRIPIGCSLFSCELFSVGLCFAQTSTSVCESVPTETQNQNCLDRNRKRGQEAAPKPAQIPLKKA